jgi:hypothetical protein
MWKCPKCTNRYNEDILECPNDKCRKNDAIIEDIVFTLKDTVIESVINEAIPDGYIMQIKYSEKEG